MHYKNGLASVWVVLITLVIMLGLAGGGYYYWHSKTVKDKADLDKKITDLTAELATLKKASTATPATTATTSTSGLKTYTNTTYGYSFQYPTADSLIDYLYSAQTGTKIEYGKIVMVDKNAIAENALKSESEVSNRYFMVTVQAGREFGLSELTSSMADMGGVLTDVTVDGVAAWKIHYTQPNIMSETYNTTIYVNHGGHGITLDIKNSDSAGTHDAAIDAIVASFKWL